MLIEAAAGGAFTKLMKPIVNQTFVGQERNCSLLLPLAIVGLFVLRGIAGYITDVNMARAGRGIARDLRVRVLGKYLRLPGLRFDTEPVPSMLHAAGLGQRPGRAGRDRCGQGDAAAVAPDHRHAGGDAVDQLAA